MLSEKDVDMTQNKEKSKHARKESRHADGKDITHTQRKEHEEKL
jgi:hypothetical protein